MPLDIRLIDTVHHTQFASAKNGKVRLLQSCQLFTAVKQQILANYKNNSENEERK